LNDRVYEFCDIKIIIDEEWTEIKIKKNIFKILLYNIKEFTRWLRFKNKENEISSVSILSDEIPDETV
jgi:hypothetical protein